MKDPNNKFAKLVEDTLKDTKAENVIKIDLFNKSSLCDYMFIATGTSSRHIRALAENIVKEFKSIRVQVTKEGGESDSWIVLDIGDIIVHIFQKDVRDNYRLEEIWQQDNPSNNS